MNRRNFLLGAAVTLVAAPAIVRVASIMPVKAVELADKVWVTEWISVAEAEMRYNCLFVSEPQWTPLVARAC